MDAAAVINFIVLPLSVYAIGVTAVLMRCEKLKKAKSTRAELTLSTSLLKAAEEKAFKVKADEALRLSNTIQKFVPRQFMDHFEQNGVGNLELGHAVEDEVAILCCDIRGFTSMSEILTPRELMRFLNSYFLRMNGPIQQNHGFIDKFIGDAIMALFDHPGGTESEKSKDAINAAIALQKTVNLYNEHRKNCHYEPVSVGIGIHYGSVIIGTVGSDDRMDTTVIGDNVNVAFRIESLAPKYQAGILVSEQVLQAAGDDYQVESRMLDFVRVKGRSKPVKIYEILEHLNDTQKQSKLRTKEDIELGLACRMKKDWEQALSHFSEALRKTPDDGLVIHHIEMCHRCQSMALPDNWDGAMTSPS